MGYKMTRRSGVYLEVLQRNAGLRDPHSLHISILICQGINACKAIGVKAAVAAVKNNFFHRKHIVNWAKIK